MAFLTIITPTYNADRFIAGCIASVQNQQFKDYEHLIVDGMSGDSTVNLVSSFLDHDKRLRLIVQKDDGVFDAMNKGIQQSKSAWYYFLGADDSLYNQDTLRTMSEFLTKTNADLVYGNVFFKDGKSIYDGPFDIEKILRKNICHQAIFYRCSVFEKLGLYKIKYKTKGDYEMNLRCWLSGRVSHEYVAKTIALYADGGLSSTNDDVPFKEDYPNIVIETVLSGSDGWGGKVTSLARIYRKIFQRYSLKTGFRHVFSTQALTHRIPAIVLTVFSLPFYFVKNLFHAHD